MEANGRGGYVQVKKSAKIKPFQFRNGYHPNCLLLCLQNNVDCEQSILFGEVRGASKKINRLKKLIEEGLLKLPRCATGAP